MTYRQLAAVAALAAGTVAADLATPAATDHVELAPLDSHPRTSVAVVDRLRHHHFESKPLDDAASAEIFDNYLNFLDPKRSHFRAADVAELDRYRHELDDALQDGDLTPAFAIYNRFHQRALERVEHDIALLKGGIEQFDFTLDESVELDRKDASWPETEEQAEDLWRQSLKGAALGAKLASEPTGEIAESLTKRVGNRLRSLRQTQSEDVFQGYMNAFARIYDDYTQYFSPRTSENFNIAMSLSLEGIGAVLGRKDEYTVVQSLVKGGPADLDGDLKANERIVAVGHSEREPFVDIVGWRIDKVVQLIRGPKGKAVRLKVMPENNDATQTRIVTIVRNVVKLEEQAASSSSIKVERGDREYRIGIVDVPTFYMDFKALREGDPNYRSTTRDVARLIDELQAEGIDALLIDLRSNGGGSLQEARELTGLFLETGPVVQVSDLSRTAVLADMDDAVVWDGPLAVLVNQLSASASEIFAGAIQDYGIGVIVGSQTFGKGTVQTLIPLQSGELKVTERMYYRVSGEGTERNGIVPDIVFPSPDPRWDERRSLADIGGAIATDIARVEPLAFPGANKVAPVLDALRGRHEARVATDPEFDYLRARKEYVERLQARTHLSLQEDARIAEKEADDAWVLEVENALLVARGEEPAADLDDLNSRRESDDDSDRPEDDTALRETGSILADFIELTQPLTVAESRAPGTETEAAVQ